MAKLFSAAVVVLALFRYASGSSIYLIDNQNSSYFTPATHRRSVGPESAAVLLSALLGLTHSFAPVPKEALKQVEDILVADVFSRPQAVVTVQLAGVDAGVVDQGEGAATNLAVGRTVHEAEFKSSGLDGASQLLRALALVASHSPGQLRHRTLDHTALPCSTDDCVEEFFQEATASLGINYTVGRQPLQGTVTDGVSKLVVLDLKRVPDRLWAVEAAALHRAVADEAARKLNSDAGEAGSEQPQLLEATLLGMQALRDAYGSSSAEFQAAWRALSALITSIPDTLAQAYGERIAAQISLLGHVNHAKEAGLAGLLQWRESHRRHLLMQGGSYGLSSNTTLTAEEWAVKSSAWLVGLIILAFLFGSCCCLGRMQFRQDTLLYARGKTD